MNPQLIQKVIELNNEHVPEFTYSNPILDRKVARALSKSFVKILTAEQNSHVSNNLRLSILENIRKICKNEQEGHVALNEDHTEIIVDFYKKHVLDIANTNGGVEKELCAYLIRDFKQLNINSNYTMSINPDIIQSLINLTSDINDTAFTDNLIHWNPSQSSSHLLSNLLHQTTNRLLANDIVIKIKPVIEKILIDSCLKTLEDEQFCPEAELSNEQYKRLFRTCTIAPYCFEICIYVLNLLLLSTNFNCKLLQLIECFVRNVKSSSSETISSLYPTYLSHIVVLLDVDLNGFPDVLWKEYVEIALKYLKDVQNESESDYLMLLSHFPQWFDLSVHV